MSKTIEIPVSLIKKLSKAAYAFHELEDELEDFLLLSDPKFLAKMRRSRKYHLAGKTRPFSELKKESSPSHEPHVRVGGEIIMVVGVFIPFTLLISLGDPELFLT